MTCPLSRSLFEDFVDNELDSNTTSELKSHIINCTKCRGEYESVVVLKRLLKTQLVPDPGEQYRQDTRELILAKTVDAEIDGWTNVSQRTKISFYQSLISVAASLCIFGAALLLGSGGNPFATRVNPASPAYRTTLNRLANQEREQVQILSPIERERIADATLLVGPAGMLGRMRVNEFITGMR